MDQHDDDQRLAFELADTNSRTNKCRLFEKYPNSRTRHSIFDATFIHIYI